MSTQGQENGKRQCGESQVKKTAGLWCWVVDTPRKFDDIHSSSRSTRPVLPKERSEMTTKGYIELPSYGINMPSLGFGTWQAKEEILEQALEDALKAGYRHIDTAPVYENEAVIGKVLKRWIDSGKVSRSELFIVTKVPPSGNRPGGIEKWINKSLEKLQLDYVDLYLIHTPFTFQEVGEDLHPFNKEGEIMFDPTTDHLKIWKEMEEQVTEGRAKAIGVSNFNIEQLQRLTSNANMPIANLQIELHVYFQQKELVKFCKNNNITITAYSPLGSRGLVKMLGKENELPDLLTNPVVVKLAAKYQKTPAQILLRHTLQQGIAAIPKSTNHQRIIENLQVHDWELTPEDVVALKALDLGESGRVCDFSFLKGIRAHPEFPF